MPRLLARDFGTALSFDGVDDKATCALDVDALSAFTVSFWARITEFTANARILDQAESGPLNGFTFSIAATKGVNFFVYNGAGVTAQIYSGTLVPGRWYHFVGVYTGTTSELFLNGASVGSDPATTMTAGAAVLTAGGRSGGGNLFKGAMDELRFWNRALGTAEIATLYSSNTFSRTGLVGEWLMNEGAGATLTDTAGSSNATVTGSAAFTSETPGRIRREVNGSLLFNGDFERAPAVNIPQTIGTRWIDGTATGSTVAEPSGSRHPVSGIFGWYVSGASFTASFDSAEKRSGGYSMKLMTTAGGLAEIYPATNYSGSSVKKYGVPCLPNTSYTMTFWMKTEAISGDSANGAFMTLITHDGEGNIVQGPSSTNVKTTTDWTMYTITLTTSATVRFIMPRLTIYGHTGAATLAMNVWFDDIELKPTVATVRPALAAVRREVNANLVFNGDFESYPALVAPQTAAGRWIDGTAAGSVTRTANRWYGDVTNGNVSFDTTEKRSGAASLKLHANAGGIVEVRNDTNGYGTDLGEGFELQPNMSYTLTFWMKTANASGDSNHGAFLSILEAQGDGSNVTTITPVFVKTNTDWTQYTQTWTSNALTRRAHVEPRIYGHTGAGNLAIDAWFDDIVIRPTTPVTRALVP